MGNRVAAKALRIVAFAGLAAGSASLAGCTTLGGSAFGDVTGSTSSSASAGGYQAMPTALAPISQSTKVAAGPYIPPEDIGGGSGGNFAASSVPLSNTVTSSALPPLTGSSTMHAQPSIASAPQSASLGALPTNSSVPQLAALPSSPPPLTPAAPAGVYTHVIESGESLYTIARRYDVTAQAIVQANGMSSPDKIFVGQRVIIPGRADLLASKGPATSKIAAIAPVEATRSPVANALVEPQKTAAINDPKLVDPNNSQTPVRVASADPAPRVPAIEPVMSGADKFRWPVSGKVSTDFITSKGTGINIDAPEGAAVRAAENGTVIYVGSGVEGYGNLVLIRHPNGYVSAYAHLKGSSVSKGDTVNRGDSIGTVGMTGSVSRPLLHFELRKGATPVDPIPLLAG
jgi:murein DD-endopeptidase MepM/ murein hydrolase activator NlpD